MRLPSRVLVPFCLSQDQVFVKRFFFHLSIAYRNRAVWRSDLYSISQLHILPRSGFHCVLLLNLSPQAVITIFIHTDIIGLTIYVPIVGHTLRYSICIMGASSLWSSLR